MNFDNGRRLMFASGFETDFDPYVDDAILIVGIQHFLDWMEHTVEAEELAAEVTSLVKNLDKNDPAFAEKVKPAGVHLKELIQKVQTPATTYFNALSDLTVPRSRRPSACRRPSSKCSMTLQARKRSKIQP